MQRAGMEFLDWNWVVLSLAGERTKDKKDILQVEGMQETYVAQGDTV